LEDILVEKEISQEKNLTKIILEEILI